MNKARTTRLVVGTLVLAVSFIGACLFIRGIFPFPEIPDVHAKRAHFLEHADDYDTLFVGSSRINHQVIPAMFDRLTAAAGQPTKSFNAGVAGMRPPEDTYFFEQLLAARPQRLRWVFIEINDIRPRIDDDLRGTVRAQYWHDWPRLKLVWQRATYLKSGGKRRSLDRLWRDLREPLADFSDHLGLFIREMSNLGKGDFLAQQLVSYPVDWRRTLVNNLGKDLSGWRPTGRGEGMIPHFQAQFEKERAERLVKPAPLDPSDEVSQSALEAMIARVERLGATPVLVLPPRGGKRLFFPRPERVAKTVALDFNDPKKFPELFDNRHRLDVDHLNTAGSEIFTRLLVEQWLAAMKGKPQH